MDQTIKEYRKILKDNGIKGKDVSEALGMKYRSYVGATRVGQPNPATWIKVFLYAFKLCQKLNQ